MAITAAEYSAIYSINSDQQTALEATHAEGHLAHLAINPEDNPFIAGVLKEIKDLQKEIDYLRTEISANKDKTSMALGTSGTTALAGDTALLALGKSGTTALAGDTSLLALGTSGTTALAGDTNIVTIGSSTTISFGDMITVTDPKSGKVIGYNIVMSVVNGGVTKTVKLTLA